MTGLLRYVLKDESITIIIRPLAKEPLTTTVAQCIGIIATDGLSCIISPADPELLPILTCRQALHKSSSISVANFQSVIRPSTVVTTLFSPWTTLCISFLDVSITSILIEISVTSSIATNLAANC